MDDQDGARALPCMNDAAGLTDEVEEWLVDHPHMRTPEVLLRLSLLKTAVAQEDQAAEPPSDKGGLRLN